MMASLLRSLKEFVNLPAMQMPIALASYADYQLRVHGRQSQQTNALAGGFCEPLVELFELLDE